MNNTQIRAVFFDRKNMSTQISPDETKEIMAHVKKQDIYILQQVHENNMIMFANLVKT